ncbi:type II toxin-antitoxin system RelE/ParE family toxin [Belliella marina]|uniref:Type II toxin-antitoxin system RelE/ParE family toxin n=1 Tax=Belliella marina TaxID=1644146 RepID=A0ABW4VS13_9BACT
MGEGKPYKVVITKVAMQQYQNRVLPYIFDNFIFDRALEIDGKIIEKASTLKNHPSRGSLEKYLAAFKQGFRFILFKENRDFELKIVYFIDETENTVYITDFFPTKMHPKKLIK